MEIKVRYENQVTTIQVPEEDFTVMIQLDYEKQLAEADDPSTVQRRTPQEIMNERFNKPDYNNWHTYNRHWNADAIPTSVYGSKLHLDANPEDDDGRHHYDMDEFPDLKALAKQQCQDRDRELRAWIRKKLKADYAEMLIAIDMDGISVTEYADQIGETRTAVSHRLQRAEKKLTVIFKKRPE